jgi:hypothetical protein
LPHTLGEAVGLELEPDREGVLLCLRRAVLPLADALLDPEQGLQMVAELVGEDVRLRVPPWRVLLLQLVEEVEVEVDPLVPAGKLEGPDLGPVAVPQPGLGRPAEEGERRRW